MTEEIQADRVESLGEYLHNLRKQKGIEEEEILQETRIPQKSFRAIEADDFSQLPADAFARGFYRLYANYLGIDPAEVIDRFDRERTGAQQKGVFKSPLKHEKKVNTMAARPSMTLGATIGFTLVILIAFVAFLSWYFSWNPATFLSDKLRSLQKNEASQAQNSSAQPDRSSTNSSLENQSPYFLTIDFLDDTTLTLSVDGSVPEEEIFLKGVTRSWSANGSISLILPESARVNIYFNGSQVNLPPPENGLISINFP